MLWMIVEKVLIPLLVMGMEKMFPEPGSGKVKAGAVAVAVQAIGHAVGVMSTGGQADEWKDVNKVIDQTVAEIFPKVEDTQPAP